MAPFRNLFGHAKSPVTHTFHSLGRIVSSQLEPREMVGVLTVPFSSKDIRGPESRANWRAPIESISFSIWLWFEVADTYIHISSLARTVHPPIDWRGYRPAHLDSQTMPNKYEDPNRATKNYQTHAVAKRHARKSK